MNEWGTPTFYLQPQVYEFAEKFTTLGKREPDLAMAGVFSKEDRVFKAIAMGTPDVKVVCIGRGLMIPGMVGKNIGKWFEEDDLPNTVSQHGRRPEEIFLHYEKLVDRFGSGIKDIPFGTLGIYSYSRKNRTGLQQIMAGNSNFNQSAISRKYVTCLTAEYPGFQLQRFQAFHKLWSSSGKKLKFY